MAKNVGEEREERPKILFTPRQMPENARWKTIPFHFLRRPMAPAQEQQVFWPRRIATMQCVRNALMWKGLELLYLTSHPHLGHFGWTYVWMNKRKCGLCTLASLMMHDEEVIQSWRKSTQKLRGLETSSQSLKCSENFLITTRAWNKHFFTEQLESSKICPGFQRPKACTKWFIIPWHCVYILCSNLTCTREAKYLSDWYFLTDCVFLCLIYKNSNCALFSSRFFIFGRKTPDVWDLTPKNLAFQTLAETFCFWLWVEFSFRSFTSFESGNKRERESFVIV